MPDALSVSGSANGGDFSVNGLFNSRQDVYWYVTAAN